MGGAFAVGGRGAPETAGLERRPRLRLLRTTPPMVSITTAITTRVITRVMRWADYRPGTPEPKGTAPSPPKAAASVRPDGLKHGG